MKDPGAVAVLAVVVAAAARCAPAPRVEPIDAATHETLPFVPFSPGAADALPERSVDDRPAVVAREAANLVSDFEQPGVALVVRAGSPPRNGTWFTYNDHSLGCSQFPTPGFDEMSRVPFIPSPGGGLALTSSWNGCTVWGAGVGAQLNRPIADGGAADGRVAPYDLTGYRGLSLYLMAEAGTDNRVRLLLPMTDDTKIADGGNCDEALVGPNRCSDAYGITIQLPTDGSWTQFTLSFADPTLRQQGWGQPFAWNPAHVTTIQIQSVDLDRQYSLWIDDVYLMR